MASLNTPDTDYRDGHAPVNPTTELEKPRNRIQVSREKKPLSFFLNLAKKFLQSEEEVELSGLGLAVTTVVTVAETLKSQGIVSIKKISTSLVEAHDDSGREYPVNKAKIQIWISKGPSFNDHVLSRRQIASQIDVPFPADDGGPRQADAV